MVPEYSSRDYNKVFSKGNKRIDVLFYDINSDEKYLIELKYKTKKHEQKTVYLNHDLKMFVGSNNKIDSLKKDIERINKIIKIDEKVRLGCSLLATDWNPATTEAKMEKETLRFKQIENIGTNELTLYWRILEK